MFYKRWDNLPYDRYHMIDPLSPDIDFYITISKDKAEEKGYVDYFNIEIYDKNEDCFGECGGGFLMMEEYIRDKNPTLLEIIQMAREFDDSCFDPKECEILSIEEGEELLEEFEELCDEHYQNLQ